MNNLVKEGEADEMVIAGLITRATDITFHDTPRTTGQTGLEVLTNTFCNQSHQKKLFPK